ncbi:hypothetical protein L211DRAFT_295555 [Terfezia boudieri ATCC MYA-4762]|uniref:Uncharacterized protein n=1 Tax=Terfezia boudieri ATCC MYA-4762 TaxID=1051890 RepID=A0A3N4LR38_9PEZI|nr:hypothetical protein L211DRAFT_295555 [Terfezia boudieri ATCC MYA-4762]
MPLCFDFISSRALMNLHVHRYPGFEHKTIKRTIKTAPANNEEKRNCKSENKNWRKTSKIKLLLGS